MARQRRGSDYVAQPTSTLSFAAGDLTKTVSVTINGDTTVEPNETFFVNLSNATNGGTITRSQGTGTISNDDSAGGVGNISINDVTITEGNSGTKVADLHGQPHRQRGLFRELRHCEQHSDSRHERNRRLRGGLGHAQLR